MKKISLTKNGARIDGFIRFRSGSDIYVEIVYPYQGLVNKLHMPTLGHNRFPDGFMGEEGDRQAEKLLAELYEAAGFLEENKSQLLHAWRGYQKEKRRARRELRGKEKRYGELKVQNEELYRHKQISKVELEIRLQTLKAHLPDRSLQFIRLENKFFDDHFNNLPVFKSCAMREQILEYLKGLDRRLS